MRERFDGELNRWVGSVALEVNIHGQTGKGNIDASPVGQPRLPNQSGANPSGIDPGIGDERSPNVVPSTAGRDQINAALVGGNFEIMSPSIADVPTQPRFFMNAYIAAVFTNDVGLARDGNPDSPMQYPAVFSRAQPVGERLIEGAGSAITVQHQGPQFHAGIGMAFTFDLWDEHRVRIKPSLTYSRMIVDIFGVANRAVRDTVFDNANRGLDQEFRTIELQAKFREVYHGVGPSLEVEYDTQNRVGPFAVSLYLKGGATRLFGDLKTELSALNPDPDAVDQERVFWKYTQDRWVFRAGTGIRFRFLPNKSR